MVNHFGQLSIYMPTYADNRRALLGSIVYCITSSIVRFLLFFPDDLGSFCSIISCSANMSLSENRVHLYHPLPHSRNSMIFHPLVNDHVPYSNDHFGAPPTPTILVFPFRLRASSVMSSSQRPRSPSEMLEHPVGNGWVAGGLLGWWLGTASGSFPKIPC